MLKSRIRKTETEKEIEISIEIDSYEDHSYNEVVVYIGGELRKALSRYVRDPEKVDNICALAREGVEYARTHNDIEDIFMVTRNNFWEITTKRYGYNKDYDVDVKLNKTNK